MILYAILANLSVPLTPRTSLHQSQQCKSEAISEYVLEDDHDVKDEEILERGQKGKIKQI